MSFFAVNVDEALALLKEADAEVDTYLNHTKTAQALADAISACWQGDSGNKMQTHLEDWILAQQRSAAKIRQNIAELRAALEDLQNADTSLAAAAVATGVSASHYVGGGRRG